MSPLSPAVAAAAFAAAALGRIQIRILIIITSELLTIPFPAYPLDLSEHTEKVEAGQLLEVLERPRPGGQKARKQGGVLGHVLQAGRSAEKKESELRKNGQIG
jgi:hypothetical protein